MRVPYYYEVTDWNESVSWGPFKTKEEAEKIVKELEDENKAFGDYEPDFWVIKTYYIKEERLRELEAKKNMRRE